MPDGTPAAGARIQGVNHDSWSKSHRDWLGTANAEGAHAWANMDTGTLGDRYTFTVNHIDPKGGKWQGEVSERIKKDTEFTVVLAKATDNGEAEKDSSGKAVKPEKGA